MAHLSSGLVGFAGGALPGERLIVTESERKRGLVRATAFLLSERAPDRVDAPCAHAGKCGGCDWLHVDYPAQLRYKLQILRDALTRVGQMEPPSALEIVPAPAPLRYRNRIRVHLDGSRVGFLARGSHELVDVESCAVASAELDRCFARFRSICKQQPELSRTFSEAELRVAPGSGRALVRLSPRVPDRARAEGASRALAALAEDFDVAVAGTPSSHVQRFEFSEGLALELPPEAFVQVNWSVNLQMVEALVTEARARGVARFADLYAGAGNFTLPLLAAGSRGVAVEGAPAAALAARRSAATLGFDATVLACDVLSGVRRLIQERQRFDLVILDPPRAGAAEVVDLLPELRPKHLAYCACDPVTLARDLKQLVNSGFRLDSACAYDMFPGTHHFETLVWMTRL
jgi:23S rRNA (uracil1939-C5)-methyltransferase